MSKIVVALGGNALGQSPEEQLELVKGTAKSLVSLIQKGYEVVISHGNGPQVGSINLGLNYATENGQGPAFPFPECGAMSQAYIGYQLQESLLNELHALNIDKQVVTLVTQVEVVVMTKHSIILRNQLAYSIQKNKRNKQWKKKVTNL